MEGNGQNPLLRIEKNLSRLADIVERLANVAGEHEQRLRAHGDRLREQEEHRSRLEKTVKDLAKEQKLARGRITALTKAVGGSKPNPRSQGV